MKSLYLVDETQQWHLISNDIDNIGEAMVVIYDQLYACEYQWKEIRSTNCGSCVLFEVDNRSEFFVLLRGD